MRRGSLLLIAILALLAWSAGVAGAASTLIFQATEEGGKGHVTCEGAVVLTIAGSAETLAAKLNTLAEAGAKASDFKVIRQGRRVRVITAQGTPLLTVDRATARARGASVAVLTQQWVGQLRKAFAKPYLSVEDISIPLGEMRSPRLLGKIVGRVQIEVEGRVVAVAWDGKRKTLQVQGREIGDTTLTVKDAKSTLVVPVRVAKYAMQFDAPVTATVTGVPPSQFATEAAVAAAVQAAIRAEPGATCEIITESPNISDLYPGRTTQVPVRISAEGAGYLPYRARPAVTVMNRNMSLSPVSLLLVSNSPEKLKGFGLWYEALLSDNKSARFLYHHVNDTGASALLTVELWNLGNEPAQVHLTAGLAGPSYDELWVGHRAAAEYLRSSARGAGWIVSIPPNTVMTVFSQLMPRGSVVSGVAELRTLGAANLSLRLSLVPPSTPTGLRPVEGYSPAPMLGEYQYPDPQRQLHARYEVGGTWAFVTIGDRPAVGIKDGDRLQGCYGVIFEVQLELVNSTDAPAATAIHVEPAGGPARGCLLVDGQSVQTKVMRTNDEVSVAEYRLAPGEKRTVTVVTMPQAGSNYPVRLVVRPS